LLRAGRRRRAGDANLAQAAISLVRRRTLQDLNVASRNDAQPKSSGAKPVAPPNVMAAVVIV
jgi:hypothetical protein